MEELREETHQKEVRQEGTLQQEVLQQEVPRQEDQQEELSNQPPRTQTYDHTDLRQRYSMETEHWPTTFLTNSSCTFV